MIQKGDKILFEATVIETRDAGNIVLQVGDRHFTASADAIERARFVSMPSIAPKPKSKPKGPAKRGRR